MQVRLSQKKCGKHLQKNINQFFLLNTSGRFRGVASSFTKVLTSTVSISLIFFNKKWVESNIYHHHQAISTFKLYTFQCFWYFLRGVRTDLVLTAILKLPSVGLFILMVSGWFRVNGLRWITFVRLKNSVQFYEIIIPVHLKDILVLFNSQLRVVLVTNWLPGAETASNLWLKITFYKANSGISSNMQAKPNRPFLTILQSPTQGPVKKICWQISMNS